MQWPHGTTRYQNSRTTATLIKIIAILFRTQRIPIPYPPHPSESLRPGDGGKAKRPCCKAPRPTHPQGNQTPDARLGGRVHHPVFLCLAVRLIDGGMDSGHRKLQESKEQSFTQHTKNNQLSACDFIGPICGRLTEESVTC